MKAPKFIGNIKAWFKRNVFVTPLKPRTALAFSFVTIMLSNPTVGLDVAIEATLVLIIAGTVAGFFPAHNATKIRPIEALRAE